MLHCCPSLKNIPSLFGRSVHIHTYLFNGYRRPDTVVGEGYSREEFSHDTYLEEAYNLAGESDIT